jgi:hypothetical protein
LINQKIFLLFFSPQFLSKFFIDAKKMSSAQKKVFSNLKIHREKKGKEIKTLVK